VPPEWLLRKEMLTAQTALTWRNTEQRRAAAEILGWKHILAELKPKTIDKDPDPQIGELLEVDLPDAPGSRFVRVMCGTKREFVLAVPQEMKTALQAQAWMWQCDEAVVLSKEART
jgi:hypothetical protein